MAIISEATKRQLKETWAATEAMENSSSSAPVDHGACANECIGTFQKMVPERPQTITPPVDHGACVDECTTVLQQMIPERPRNSTPPVDHGAYADDCTTALQRMMPERPLNGTPPHSEPGRAQRRSLPSRQITDDNFDDAYVDFIMHCNPSVPLDTDTSELRKSFRGPPKSDGKTFSSFALFELIRKLESKEIKTWAQLAIDLGVEPPALDKGQSAQKVQQYAVRLKRWMHAMHVDAFFEYLLNKTHAYWTQVPSINEPPSEFGRDGVTAEEDLALRALLPEFRPKRGRRKAEDKDNDSDEKSPSQRPRLDSPTLSEDFMIARACLIGGNATPASAHPSFNQTFDNRLSSPWSWSQGATETAQTPLTAYPHSAMTPSSNRSGLWADMPEPQSAITPNKLRSRRKHGPTVSSAWSSSAGKLRGRPPSNRSVTDGPFSMFPVNPTLRDTPTISLRDNPLSATPVIGDSEMPHFFPPGNRSPNHHEPNPADPLPQSGRPNRLQLQVPLRQGGSVRLATPPPPMVLLNGQNDNSILPSSNPPPVQNPTSLMEYFHSPTDINSHNPFISIAFHQAPSPEPTTNICALESHFICEILAAEWYNASGHSVPRCSIDEADKICKQVIKNLQAESSSTEAFLINLSALAGGPLMERLVMVRMIEGDGRKEYEGRWRMRFGGLEGSFTIRVCVDEREEEMGGNEEEMEESWKKQYLDLQLKLRDRDEKVGNLKRRLLNALVESNQFSSI